MPGRHRQTRRRRSTFEAGRQRSGVLVLPGDLVKPGLLITAADQWSWRMAAAYFERRRNRNAAPVSSEPEAVAA